MAEKETKKGIELTEVATATAPAFKLPNDKVISLEEYLVWIGNEIVEIKKAIA